MGMMVALSGARVLPVGIYSKNYKVRLFRRTNVVFGEPISISSEEKLGLKEQALFITDRLFEEISKLEKEAREEVR